VILSMNLRFISSPMFILNLSFGSFWNLAQSTVSSFKQTLHKENIFSHLSWVRILPVGVGDTETLSVSSPATSPDGRPLYPSDAF
jgi:hypothetical protein